MVPSAQSHDVETSQTWVYSTVQLSEPTPGFIWELPPEPHTIVLSLEHVFSALQFADELLLEPEGRVPPALGSGNSNARIIPRQISFTAASPI